MESKAVPDDRNFSPTEFLDNMGDYLEFAIHLNEEYIDAPKESSVAFIEQTKVEQPKKLVTALSIANLYLNAAADHFSAAITLFREPAHTHSPWTCARGVIEASAWSAWLFDETVDLFARLSRSYAGRYKALDEQRKFTNSVNDKWRLRKISERMKFVEQEAIGLGINVRKDKNNKTIGLGAPIKTITDFVEEILGMGAVYRLLSSVAHGSPTSTMQVAYDKQIDDKGTFLEPSLNFGTIISILGICFRAINAPIYIRQRYLGFETLDLEKKGGLIETIIDEYLIEAFILDERRKR